MTSACLASAAFISKPQKFRLLHISSTPDSANSSGTCLPRPAVILPGLGNNTGDYEKLQMTLMEKGGVPSVVAKVSRFDWFRNAAGLVDANYWKGTLIPRPVLDWYLKRVDDAVREAKELAEGGGTFSVIGHSAGGWLARVYMEEFGRDGISLLLTLGTPHLPPPKGLPGVIDQTRGLLYNVEEQCAKPEYTPEVKYVCIAGRYIQGSPIFGPSDVASDYTTTSLNTIQPHGRMSGIPVRLLSPNKVTTFCLCLLQQGNYGATLASEAYLTSEEAVTAAAAAEAVALAKAAAKVARDAALMAGRYNFVKPESHSSVSPSDSQSVQLKRAQLIETERVSSLEDSMHVETGSEANHSINDFSEESNEREPTLED
ncbi:unnamed protein product [Rhodiola kirilowii]